MKKHIANAIVSLFLSACILSAATNDFVFYQVPASGPLTKKLVTPGTSKLFGFGSSASTPVTITIGSGLSLNTSTNTLTSSGGSGDVATDAIFDAAGDLIQGTGANTSARVALGTSGQLLRVKSDLTGVEWATISGTGSVTSVAVSGSDGIEIDSGSPITTSGTIALGINASTLKTHLSLANVENTALSTWAGTTNITTLGTISAGTWNGTAIGTGYLASGATLDTEWDTASEINAATTDADFLTTTLAASTYAPLTGAAFTGANTTTLALTTTPTAASSLINSATATVGAQKVSPSIVWTGSGWKTTATAAGQEVSFRANVLPVQGSTSPSGIWQLQSQINGGGFTDRLTVTSGGAVTATAFYGTTFQGNAFNDANLVTGSENTALGIGALDGNATGSGNTVLGDFAGATLADETTSLSAPTNGVYIGAITRGSTINESNAIVIGYNALSEGSNKTVIGNSSTTAAHIFGTVTGDGTGLTGVLPTAGGTMTGSITLGENTSVKLDPAGSADGKYSGTTVSGTAGATLAFGDVVVLDVTDSRWELADANSAAAADGDSRAMLGICVLAAASDGSATTILLHGIVRADAAFPALTVGAPVYVSETAGDAVVTQPTTADVVIRVIGHALTADEMFFNPDNTWITHL